MARKTSTGDLTAHLKAQSARLYAAWAEARRTGSPDADRIRAKYDALTARLCRFSVGAYCPECGADSCGAFRTLTEARAAVRGLLAPSDPAAPVWDCAGIYDNCKQEVVWVFNSLDGAEIYEPAALLRSNPDFGFMA